MSHSHFEEAGWRGSGSSGFCGSAWYRAKASGALGLVPPLCDYRWERPGLGIAWARAASYQHSGD